MELMKAIINRQSCRSYKTEQISDEQLEIILQAANAAPVGSAKYDEVKLTVVQNQELLNKLDEEAGIFFGNPDNHPLYGAPTLILVSTKVPQKHGSISPYCNAACIVENMSLAATGLGLGNVYILGAITALSKNEELCKQFKVPEGFFPTSALAIGNSAVDLEEKEITINKIKTEYLK